MLALILFSPLVSAQGEILEVKYAVMSNGSDALIPLEILTYVPYCPPLSGIDCDNATTGEVLGGDEYLIYFNGSKLYLLNFTPAFTTLYPNYNSLLDLQLHGARFVKGSWYLNITFYPPMAEVSGVYRFNPDKFCIEPANISWFQLSTGEIKGEIDDWRIVLQSKSFENWDHANASDLWVTMSKTALRWSPGPTEVVNSSVFPVYFILKKGKQVRNITLVYLNMNVTRDNFTGPAESFWFPEDIKIVNVTVCKSIITTPNETMGHTTVRENTTTPIEKTATPTSTTKTGKSICGPGLIVIIALCIALLLKRRYGI